MRALIAGFEPYGGEAANASTEAVSRLPETIGTVELVKLKLPTVYAQALAALTDSARAQRPDVILIVAQAGGRPEISLERVAINLDDAEVPDNEGHQITEQPVTPGGPPAYLTALPLRAFREELLRAGIPAAISTSAGSYVGNHVYYGALHLAADELAGTDVLLLHVPYLPLQAARQGNTPSMSAETVIAALAVLIEGLCRHRAGGGPVMDAAPV